MWNSVMKRLKNWTINVEKVDKRSTGCKRNIKVSVVNSLNKLKFDIRIEVGDEKEIFTEYLIYDTLNFIGALGGTLGLFIGFSFFQFFGRIIDFFGTINQRVQQHKTKIKDNKAQPVKMDS